jgi:hypothetical protein
MKLNLKDEGVAFTPVPVGRVRETLLPSPRTAPPVVAPRCEMCGHSVIATHCKRICVRCGFMTGCSEGI